jgi:hypothetical protein
MRSYFEFFGKVGRGGGHSERLCLRVPHYSKKTRSPDAAIVWEKPHGSEHVDHDEDLPSRLLWA